MMSNDKPTHPTKRPICLKFRVSQAERALIAEKMAAANIQNREAYIRKMILDGYVLKLDFTVVKRMVHLLSNATNNINQIAKRANESRSVHAADVQTLQAELTPQWSEMREIMRKLAAL